MLAYAGKGRFVIEPVNLSSQVAEIVPLVQTSLPHKVELNLRLADDLPLIEADPSQLQQLVMNLAINAAEAVGETAGAVTITTSARETQGERQVVLEVRDTGCGMDDVTRFRIFDPLRPSSQAAASACRQCSELSAGIVAVSRWRARRGTEARSP